MANGIFAQVILTNAKNSPKSQYRYHFDIVTFYYPNLFHGGVDTIWDVSGLTFRHQLFSRYYTSNPNFISFEDVAIGSLPPEGDTSYLRSVGFVYKATDSVFYTAYAPLPWVYGNPIDSVYFPILKYPFGLNSSMDMGSWSMGIYNGYIICSRGRIGDGSGTLILPDTTIDDVLRTRTYSIYTEDSEFYYHKITDTIYEWYANTSEQPLLTIKYSDDFESYYGNTTHFNYYSAWIYTGKTYEPFTLGVDSEHATSAMSVYPNPSAGKFNISLLKPFSDLKIFDQMGNLVKEVLYENNHADGYTAEVDLSGFSQGIYLLQVTHQDGTIVSGKQLLIQ